MGSNATGSTALASGGLAGAGVVILVWLLSLFHVTMPADVAASFMVVLAGLIHAGVLKWAIDPVPEEPTAMVPVTVEAPAPVVSPSLAEPKPAAPPVVVVSAPNSPSPSS